MKLFPGNMLRRLKQLFQSTDVAFLLFLLLFLNIKLPIKLFAVVFIYFMRPNFKFGLSFGKQSRLPLFYVVIILLGFLNFFINGNLETNYIFVFLCCVSVWGIGLLAIHQIKLAIEKNGVEKVGNALRVFFIANAVASVLNIVAIIIETKSLNPYTFEGLSYKYFTSTGDYVRGIMFDMCTTNMIINAFGLFYFLYLEKYLLSAMCLLIVLLTTSNLGNIVLIFFLIVSFFFLSGKLNKSIILCYFGVLCVFMVKVSPANLDYFVGSLKKFQKKNSVTTSPAIVTVKKPNTDSLLRVYVSRKGSEKFREKEYKELMAKASSIYEIGLKVTARKTEDLKVDSSFDKRNREAHSKMIDFCKTVYGDSLALSAISSGKTKKYPGKLISFLQTKDYLLQNKKNLFLGAGPGNFSSKFAFRALGLRTDGAWLQNYTYMSPDFKNNHLKLWMSYQIQPQATHSVLNFPNSELNHILGEYGLIGLILFLMFYVYFFVRKYKLLTFGRILIPLMLAFLLTDYWFENLSILIVFETMLLLDIHKKNITIE